MSHQLANGMKMLKGIGNITTLLFSLKRLEILHQERRVQVKTIVMEHFNGILFHKSGPANKQHINQLINQEYHQAVNCVQWPRSRILIWRLRETTLVKLSYLLVMFTRIMHVFSNKFGYHLKTQAKGKVIEILNFKLTVLMSMESWAAAKKDLSSVAVPPVPVCLTSQRPLALSVVSVGYS